MQNVKFRSLHEFFEFIPHDELRIVELLRSIVFECIPDVREKLSYNVPFYARHKNICFIWASSVLWGKKKSFNGVRFGFTSGHLLIDKSSYLSKENRKYVYWRDFSEIEDINIDLLKSYLCEAVVIDEKLHVTQISKSKK